MSQRTRRRTASRGRRPLTLLSRWPLVGWCVGLNKEAGKDKRYTIEDEVVKFHVHYEIDADTSRHVLTRETYGGDEVGS